MNVKERYESAKAMYAKIGVDTDAALERLKGIPISMHCWQGDDVIGFDHDGPLTGGIQTTGNYPGRARNPEELMADIEKALSLIPGKHKVNLHACYAIFEDGERADRDKIEPKHFAKWVEFGKKNGVAFDFNPTCFSHPMAEDSLTLSSPNETVRKFWVDHCIACIKISEYLAAEQGCPCAMNIWIPDGMKDVPADRLGPRARFKQSLDEILAVPYDKEKVLVCLESKVFGIGMESYTVGSSEFTINYAARNGIISLMDNGHYHPTEVVSDKISSMLLFNDMIALHVTRGVRWDSDHVVLFDDETREIAKEIVRNDAIDRVLLALDYFDASINRISAWVTGMRNMQKALLYALLSPNKKLKELQDVGKFTELMMRQEEMKTYPLGDVWNYFCELNGAPVQEDWFAEIEKYEEEVLSKRK
ncbi:MAG: L-rhamnose isomerase [Lachnospiraceae bacterium]|jgi:L-rhamnose isomerase|nr:L-rhamnose isomerase [Lachnospiraceae bacterium]